MAEEQRDDACASTSPREKMRGREVAEETRNGLSLAGQDDKHQPEGRLSCTENRQAKIHPTDSQPNGSEEITCRAHNNQIKLFPIFKQSTVTEETKRLVEIEQNQPSGRKTVNIWSLKELCERNLKSTSRMVKSLSEICREIVRNSLHRNRDTQKRKEKLREDCWECGPGIHGEDKESYLIGSDVVALFPSIKSMSTGLIVRNRVEKSSLKFPGFNHRQGARYIKMNKKYTGDLQGLRSVLPRRKELLLA